MAATNFEIISSTKKGRGLYARRAISEGEILFEENPLVCSQFAWNEDYGYLACSYCLRALETAEQNVRRLCQDASIALPIPDASPTVSHTLCECGAIYCSIECQEKALSEYHASLCCPPGLGKAVALQKLRDIWKDMQHPPETATIFLLIKFYAMVHQGENKEMIISRYDDFFCNSSNSTGNIFQKLLGPQFNIDILLEAVNQCVLVLGLNIPPEWLTLQGFISKLAKLALNNQGIGTSAFSQWVSNTEKITTLPPEEQARLDNLITELYNKMEDVVGLEFLNNEGSGMYSLQSKINHSCDPNVEVTFPNGNYTLAVRALTDIAPGHEICSSYIDECALARSRHSRQNILRENYFFDCLCNKCEEQAADPDESSSEEEDVDMSS